MIRYYGSCDNARTKHWKMIKKSKIHVVDRDSFIRVSNKVITVNILAHSWNIFIWVGDIKGVSKINLERQWYDQQKLKYQNLKTKKQSESIFWNNHFQNSNTFVNYKYNKTVINNGLNSKSKIILHPSLNCRTHLFKVLIKNNHNDLMLVFSSQ